MSLLSVTEQEYLRTSLESKNNNNLQPIRPDGRKIDQFRPMGISLDFLPTSNGSTRLVSSDGTEIIVSSKVECVDATGLDLGDFLVIDLDIQGYRDDSIYVNQMKSILYKSLNSKLMESGCLKINAKYSFKLCLDVLVLSKFSYPLSLISMAIYTTLQSTNVPMLLESESEKNANISGRSGANQPKDIELNIDELPQFNDYDMKPLNFQSPLIFLIALIGDNCIVDPSELESSVADNCLLVSFYDKKVTAPIKSISLNDSYIKGFTPQHLQKSIKLVEKIAPDVVAALN
ncbi:Exosome complex component RRP42 [Hanseniaspora osmophila]|uniref:Ribosomal RNA-processing protein 42 n=1 Tax=Hanseniaspora osmophila TaxID=56408 RepID=A0A1E5RMZ7_9ASCO|nr:Exosome complex component RRP42 [Hanseniaspora osmophila]